MPSPPAIRRIAPFDLAGSARASTVILVARSLNLIGYLLCPHTQRSPCHHCPHQTRGTTVTSSAVTAPAVDPTVLRAANLSQLFTRV
ncbi:hypothetical protein PRAC110570_13020 [Propionibacterium acidifaciens]